MNRLIESIVEKETGYLGFRDVFRQTIGPDGKVIEEEFDPHASLDRALQVMREQLAPPDAETLKFVVNRQR
jgi:hypothetical protein